MSLQSFDPSAIVREFLAQVVQDGKWDDPLSVSEFVGDPWEGDGLLPANGLRKRKAPPSPLARIVALGADALPELLRRLDSTRPTAIRLDSMWHGYFVNPLWDSRRPAKTDPWSLPYDAYGAEVRNVSLTEGDLAYFLVGQVVNRWYAPMRGGPGPLFLSMPSISPHLKRVVRGAWGKTDRRGLERSLRDDVLHPDSPAREALGFRRYALYFPEVAESLAAERLKAWVAAPPRYAGEDAPPFVFSFVFALGSLRSPRVDELCLRLLAEYDRRLERRRAERNAMFALASLLYRRPNTHEAAVAFARRQVARESPPSTMFERLAERSPSTTIQEEESP